MRYEGIAAKLQKFPHLDVPAVWAGLQVIESAFLVVSAEKRDKEQSKGGRRGA